MKIQDAIMRGENAARRNRGEVSPNAWHDVFCARLSVLSKIFRVETGGLSGSQMCSQMCSFERREWRKFDFDSGFPRMACSVARAFQVETAAGENASRVPKVEAGAAFGLGSGPSAWQEACRLKLHLSTSGENAASRSCA